MEEKGGALKVQKHYAAGSTIIAVRTVTAEADTLQWMISDHLPLQGASRGSTSTTANVDGTWNSDIRYTAFGEIRLKSGVTASGYRYTSQLDMQGSIGLDYYVASFYDPQLARFAQADTVIPDPKSTLSFDRYAYVHNNPIRNNDPTGHICKQYVGNFCVAYSNDTWSPPSSNSTRQVTSHTYYSNKIDKSTSDVLYRLIPTSTPTPQTVLGPGPTNTPTFTRTPTLETLLKPGPTNTPTPGYEYKPRTYKNLSIDWERLIDTNKVDAIDFWIDIAGITGDIAMGIGSPIGLGYYGLTEAAEVAGIGKTAYDVFNGKPSNAILRIVETISETARLSPKGGSVFNLFSLAINIFPAVNPNAIKYD